MFRKSKRKLVVVLGDFNNRGEAVEEGEERRGLREVVIHPEYRHSNYDNDIALLQLDTPVTFNKWAPDHTCLSCTNTMLPQVHSAHLLAAPQPEPHRQDGLRDGVGEDLRGRAPAGQPDRGEVVFRALTRLTPPRWCRWTCRCSPTRSATTCSSWPPWTSTSARRSGCAPATGTAARTRVT